VRSLGRQDTALSVVGEIFDQPRRDLSTEGGALCLWDRVYCSFDKSCDVPGETIGSLRRPQDLDLRVARGTAQATSKEVGYELFVQTAREVGHALASVPPSPTWDEGGLPSTMAKEC
jgi:hypothetical protein